MREKIVKNSEKNRKKFGKKKKEKLGKKLKRKKNLKKVGKIRNIKCIK